MKLDLTNTWDGEECCEPKWSKKKGHKNYAPFLLDPKNTYKFGMLDYPERDKVWVDVTKPFTLKLSYKDYYRGRSSCTFWFTCDESGMNFPMKVGAFSDMIKEGVKPISVIGTFRVEKQGSNFSLKYLGE